MNKEAYVHLSETLTDALKIVLTPLQEASQLEKPIRQLANSEIMALTAPRMDQQQGERLGRLVEKQQEDQLDANEQGELANLMQVYNQLWIRQSEALAEAVRRGLRKDQLADFIAAIQARQVRPVTLIAIDGHSAAGKSSLAAALQAALPAVTVIHTDDFYQPMNEAGRFALDAADGYQQYYDWQRLERQVLAPLAQGQTSRYQRYDWTTNRLGVWVEVQATGIIVVEGCYAARPELRHYYQFIVIVEADANERARRQAARADATPDWLNRWDAAERHYMTTVQPHAYADMIILGE